MEIIETEATEYKFPDDYLSIFEFAYYTNVNYFYAYSQYRVGKFRGKYIQDSSKFGFRSKHFILIDELRKYGWSDEMINKLKLERMKKFEKILRGDNEEEKLQ